MYLPTLIFAVTLVLTLTLPPGFVRLTRRGVIPKRFWVAVDGAWIVLGVFALWFAASELERIQVRSDADAKRVGVEAEWRGIRGSATFTQDILNFGKATQPAAAWFKYFVAVLDLGPDNFKWQWFLGQNEDLWKPRRSANESRVPQGLVDFPRLDPADPHAEEAREILIQLADFQTRYRFFESAEKQARELNVRPTARLVFALLFPLAFALRLSKAAVDWVSSQEPGSERLPKPIAPSDVEVDITLL